MSVDLMKKFDTEAYRYRGEVIEVSLTWLMKNIDSSVDFGRMETVGDWELMMADKCSDTGFMHLVWSIMERGFMPQGSIGYSDGQITEGHHRLCAAVLLGLDTVWISAYGGRVYTENGRRNLANAHSNWEDPQPLVFA